MSKTNHKLTSAEIGKLWATYMGNSMAKCILSYFLQHVDDEDIKKVVIHALNLSEELLQTITDKFHQESFPIPEGFTKDDVNLGAPRLFSDEFYLHYLRYTGKVGLNLYSIAIPLITRLDVREFFTHCLTSTEIMLNLVTDTLNQKGLLEKPPFIPIPNRVDYVKKQNYLTGFFGNIRPLHALEIAHLHDIIENNVTSKALLIGFCQVTKKEKVKDYFVRGKEITSKQIETCSQQLFNENLPAPPLLDHLVTPSTFSPFSDKLMMFHKVDMFSMKIRTYGNSLSVNGRHDIGVMYARFSMAVAMYIEDGMNIMIDQGWLEQMPEAADRDTLASK